MRKAFGGVVCAALAVGLVAAAASGGASARTSVDALDGADARAAAQRATDVWRGTLKRSGPGTKIVIRATVRRGKPRTINAVDYRGLPAACEASGDELISGGWTLEGVRVNNRRKFRAVGNDGGPPGMRSSLRFTGRFSANFNKVRGKFQTTVYFPKGPEETCVGETKRYVATR
jgi:hypothetical protein